MSASHYTEDHCEHLSYRCSGGWHECNDCRRGLGDKNHVLEAHAVNDCAQCGPRPGVSALAWCIHNKHQVCAECEGIVDTLIAGSRFVTKDSGKREQFNSGMQRDTQAGKARWDLLFAQNVPYESQFFTRVAELLARGAEKYDARNWEQAAGVEEMERFKASALRHLMQWLAGDTEEDHASAVVFNLLGYETTKWKLDNGPQDSAV